MKNEEDRQTFRRKSMTSSRVHKSRGRSISEINERFSVNKRFVAQLQCCVCSNAKKISDDALSHSSMIKRIITNSAIHDRKKAKKAKKKNVTSAAINSDSVFISHQFFSLPFCTVNTWHVIEILLRMAFDELSVANFSELYNFSWRMHEWKL